MGELGPLQLVGNARVDHHNIFGTNFNYRGAAVYAMFCASCHGARGAGDGPLAANLDPKPADHSDGRYMNTLSDAHVFQVIQQGGASVGKSPLMAPFGASLSDAQIRDLIAHVRSLSGT